MGAYHQMGHDSWNLVTEKYLDQYRGIILSPINEDPASAKTKVANVRGKKPAIEVILDPQYYEPRSDRGHLTQWPHFSADVDTANLQDIAWWQKPFYNLINVARNIGADSVCSPAIMPRVYDDAYYKWVVGLTDSLYAMATNHKVDVYLTAIIRIPELAQKGRPESIAGILTSTDITKVYLVFSDDLQPRTQREDVAALSGAMALIKLLEAAGSQVLVAFTGLDMLLWKAAGASNVATGKFFNLRRFMPGRFDDDVQEGGRVVPYWTDNKLITWLREADIKLLDSRGLVDRQSALLNPYSAEILNLLDSGTGDPWLKHSWRQYMYWFQLTEAAISQDRSISKKMLIDADLAWGAVSSSGVYMYDRQNTGTWIRPWLNVISSLS